QTVVSLSQETQSEISNANDEDYPIKICCNISTPDLDDDCEYCTSQGYYWDLDGGPSCGSPDLEKDFLWGSQAIQEPYCCGNDINEYYLFRNISIDSSGNNNPSFDEDIDDNNCCDAVDDCVYGDKCYTKDQGVIAYSDVADDVICTNDGRWYDCDYDENSCSDLGWGCGLAWVAGGEDIIIGEYDNETVVECCGDDADEYYNYRRDVKGSFIDTGDSACCNIDTDCIWNSSCYDSEELPYILGPEIRRCTNGEWGPVLDMKCSWDNGTCRYCDDTNTQCNTVLDECVDSGYFKLDYFCENGSWASRTKLVALQLLEIAANSDYPDNYTLFCDDYENSLNYFDYLVPSTVPGSKAWNFLEGYSFFGGD
ncbi:unnamed protein product, partial [marine sediment metagenome]